MLTICNVLSPPLGLVWMQSGPWLPSLTEQGRQVSHMGTKNGMDGHFRRTATATPSLRLRAAISCTDR